MPLKLKLNIGWVFLEYFVTTSVKGLKRTFPDIDDPIYIDGDFEEANDDDEHDAGLFWEHIDIVHDFVVS